MSTLHRRMLSCFFLVMSSSRALESFECTDECASSLDGVCDEPHLCSLGTDCTDCFDMSERHGSGSGISELTFIIVIASVGGLLCLFCTVVIYMVRRRVIRKNRQPELSAVVPSGPAPVTASNGKAKASSMAAATSSSASSSTSTSTEKPKGTGKNTSPAVQTERSLFNGRVVLD